MRSFLFCRALCRGRARSENDMETIRSSDNKYVKHIAKLKLKKYRDEYGEYFVEGYKNVLDSCSACPEHVKRVVLSESGYAAFGDKFTEFDTVVLADGVFSKFAETQSDQGIISVNAVKPSLFPAADACILLDRVRDPGNVGTILRTAVACGYDVIVNDCADVYSPKVVRSAMSALAKCRIGTDIAVADVKAAGYELIVADMHGENAFGATRANKYCVVIGNEGQGVSADIVKAADRLLALPQNDMESLNASVAAGVMMFALKYACK